VNRKERKNRKKNKNSADIPMISTDDVLALPVELVLNKLNVSSSGLTAEEAESRLENFGYNEATQKATHSVVIDFLSHFKSPITIILIIAAILSAFLGDARNTVIIFVIVLVSVILDFTQEYRAEKAAEALKKRVATTATTIRDNAKQEVEVSLLVPGDLIFLSVGDIIPADARVMTAKDFFVDQSALTGESFPVEKTAEAVIGTDNDSNKWNNYLFMGASVTNGTATAVIIKTGSATQYGEIMKKSAERKPETEFDKGMKRFGYLIMQVTFVLVIFVFLMNSLFNERKILDSILFAVALTVGLTPGLLPMILSINLSRGATNMSKKGVIVKRLSAIQNFGSMDVLCADKTGTLTENRVTVILHVDIDAKDSDKVFLYSLLNSRYQTGLRSPLDDAILKYKDINTDQYRMVDEIPFDFIRRRLSVVVSEQEKQVLITKGAPEEISGVISQYEYEGQVRDLTEEIRSRIDKQHRELSSQGFRVLGVSYRNLVETKLTYSVADEKSMVFLGFIAFMDPLKETAGESIELLRQAGVKLKILTGDNEIVAAKISQQLGFQVMSSRRGKRFDQVGEGGRIVRTVETGAMNIVRGSEVQSLDDTALARIVEKADVFTRVTPAQKSRIINALKVNGHTVGYIGDGINDTPSMKVADVGISVVNAVDIAKETAEIILMNNDLKVIRDGVIEGRKTFGNTMKYILMAISSNFGNMFSAAAASMFLSFLPMLPIQILLNNLLYSFAQLSIPMDNVDHIYVLTPQKLDTRFIRNFMIFFGPVSSIFDFLTFAVMIFVFHASPSLFQTAWFIESLFTQTLVIFAIRTRTIPFYKSKPNNVLVYNIVAVLAIAIIIPFTFVGRFFGFVSLPVSFIVLLGGFIVVYLSLVELMKIWFYRRRAGFNGLAST